MVKIPRFSSNWINIVSLVVIAIAVIVAGFYFLQYQKTQKLLKNPTEKAKIETQELIKEVGEVFLLPTGTPTIATVSDKSKLNQAFFASAQNGDKVLIYTDSKKAILYRPSSKQVIEVGPITIQNNQAASQSATAQTSITVAVLNGTTRTGLTKNAGDRIAAIKGFEVTDRTNAEKNDYPNSLVIDVTGKNKAVVEALAKELGAKVGTLPTGENKPTSSILVILGQDYKE